MRTAYQSVADVERRTDTALEFTRAAYDNVVAWNDGQERKAFALLTLDGALIAAFAAVVFARSTDDEVESLAPATTVLLVVAAVGFGLSVLATLISLWPRRWHRGGDPWWSWTVRFYRKGKDGEDADTENVWFFGAIAQTKRSSFVSYLHGMDERKQICAIGDQIDVLSFLVRQRQARLSLAVILLGSSLVLLVAAAALEIA